MVRQHRPAKGFQVFRDAQPAAHDLDPFLRRGHRDRDPLLDDVDTGTANRPHDPAPVRLTRAIGRLDQGRVGDRRRHLPGRRVGTGAANADFDHPVRSLGVGDQGDRQTAQQTFECVGEPLKVLRRGRLDTGGAVGENQDAVVRARVAVDRDAVERRLDGSAQRLIERRRRDRGIGRDEGQGGRHVRRHHAGALGDAADRHFAAPEFHRLGLDLGPRIGGQDRFRRPLAAVRTQFGGRLVDAGQHLGHRQGNADDARRRDEDVLGIDLERRPGTRGHGPCIRQARFTGAGVRVAAVGHDRPRPAARRHLAAVEDGRGLHLVAREHARHGRRLRGRRGDDREIQLLRLQAAVDAGGDEAPRGGHAAAHGNTGPAWRPVVSGRPSITFMFCTACPAAPLTRLSMAENVTASPRSRSTRTAMSQ